MHPVPEAVYEASIRVWRGDADADDRESVRQWGRDRVPPCMSEYDEAIAITAIGDATRAGITREVRG